MPIRSFRDAKCLLTGAASGIGRATALLLAREGAALVLTDRFVEPLDAVVREVIASGGRVLASEAFDITDHDRVERFAASVHEAHGAMDVVMNIAGISVWGTVENLEHHHWRDVVEVNLMGPIHVIEAFVPPMVREGRGGHLVNVSSAAGLFGLPWHAAYSATKFGLRGISEVLRFDLARHGIGVSLVCPGGVDTPLQQTVRIVGVDSAHPAITAFRSRFKSHAVSPETAARAILRGVRKNRYLVFTSPDIAIGHFFQTRFPFPYEVAMRFLNDRFHELGKVASLEASGREGRAR